MESQSRRRRGGAPDASHSAADPGASDATLAALERRTRAALERERGFLPAVRATSRPLRLALVALAVALDVLFFHRFLLRADIATYSRPRLVAMLLAAALVLVGSAWQALRPLHRAPLSRPAFAVLLGAALALPAVFALLPEAPTTPPPGFSFPGAGWWCFATGLTQGVALVLLVHVLDRGGRADASALFAAAAGAALGLLGLLVTCPINYPLHLVTGHATVPLVLVAGAWLHRRAAR